MKNSNNTGIIEQLKEIENPFQAERLFEAWKKESKNVPAKTIRRCENLLGEKMEQFRAGVERKRQRFLEKEERRRAKPKAVPPRTLHGDKLFVSRDELMIAAKGGKVASR